MSNKMALDALKFAEAALADIGDADREPGDDLAWCEARAAEALPQTRAAIAALQAEPQPAQSWTRVADGLPPRLADTPASDLVLCWMPGMDRPHVDCAYYEHQHKNYNYGGPKVPAFNTGYTHWMPLPTLPLIHISEPTRPY